MTGVVYLDPQTAIPMVTADAGTEAFVEEDPYFVSQPIELAGQGSLSRIVDLSGVDPQDCEICWGREVLWFGRFEQDEGYHMWNLNSNDEWLDETIFKEGEHSLCLHRAHNSGGNVVTMIDRHIPADSIRYSLTGWMKTENAHDARFSVRFYSGRYTWNPIETVDMGDPVEGTSDWTWYGRNMRAPDDAEYYNIRCNLDRPGQGDAYAWFDDLRVIEWLPWQPLALPLDVPFPNNFRFVQIRVPGQADSVTVAYEETALTDGGYAGISDPDSAPRVGALLRGAAPNPFRGATTISYRLSATARVSLEVFDLNGRLIERLAHEERQRPGWHRVAWEAPGAAAGIYFTRLTVNGESHARKMVRLK
jgi:hypothetical protein